MVGTVMQQIFTAEADTEESEGSLAYYVHQAALTQSLTCELREGERDLAL